MDTFTSLPGPEPAYPHSPSFPEPHQYETAPYNVSPPKAPTSGRFGSTSFDPSGLQPQPTSSPISPPMPATPAFLALPALDSNSGLHSPTGSVPSTLIMGTQPPYTQDQRSGLNLSPLQLSPNQLGAQENHTRPVTPMSNISQPIAPLMSGETHGPVLNRAPQQRPSAPQVGCLAKLCIIM